MFEFLNKAEDSDTPEALVVTPFTPLISDKIAENGALERLVVGNEQSDWYLMIICS